jgi:uncharacterized protein
MAAFSDGALPPIINELLESIEACQNDNDKAHGIDHVLCVITNCRAIFQEVACNQEIVLFAACLHDTVSRKASRTPSESANHAAEQAGRWLVPLGVNESIVHEVSDCIRTASWEQYLRSNVPLKPEAHVLRDADLLESIGARGVARVFTFAGAHDLGLDWTNINSKNVKTLTPSIDELEGPFKHLETKLLRVKDMMYSEVARVEAERRHKFLLSFIDQYESELNWGYSC